MENVAVLHENSKNDDGGQHQGVWEKLRIERSETKSRLRREVVKDSEREKWNILSLEESEILLGEPPLKVNRKKHGARASNPQRFFGTFLAKKKYEGNNHSRKRFLQQGRNDKMEKGSLPTVRQASSKFPPTLFVLWWSG